MSAILNWLTAGTPPHYLVILAFTAFLIWEAWLGHTQRVRANSTLALVGGAIATAARRVVFAVVGLPPPPPEPRKPPDPSSLRVLLPFAFLLLTASACAHNDAGGIDPLDAYRKGVAVEWDAFRARVRSVPAECLTVPQLVASWPAGRAFLRAAPMAWASWEGFLQALKLLYDVPSVRCAVEVARGVERTVRPSGEAGARGVPAGGETTYRAEEALDRLAERGR